jgi:hypothetical protein
MTGKDNGVAARMMKDQPFLVPIHCIAHREALAAQDAGSEVNYIDRKFKAALTELFWFIHNSSVRLAKFQAIQVPMITSLHYRRFPCSCADSMFSLRMHVLSLLQYFSSRDVQCLPVCVFEQREMGLKTLRPVTPARRVGSQWVVASISSSATTRR